MSRLPPISDQDWTAYTAQRFRTRALRQIAESMPALPKYTPPPAPAAAPSAVAGAPPSPVPPPVAAAPTLTERPPEGYRPSQLTMPQAMAVCGPAAALAFAKRTGRTPTPEEAMGLAQQVGWTPERGMAGPASQKALLDKMGIPSRLETGVNWAKVRADVEGGNPVIIDTPGHYFVAEGYDPTTDKFDFGTSATDLKGGSRWMSPAELNRTKMGAARSALFLDNPDPATGPSVAVTQPQARPPVVTEGAPAYQHAETDEGLAAQKYGLDPDIFFRQISQESGGKATAVSPAGARGVGQFMPQTAAGVAQRMGGGVTAEQIMSDKAVGLDAAAFHMREMLDTYGGDYAKALAAYNAGPGAVAKYGGVPPFKETQTYIQRILGDARPVAGAAPPPTTTPLEAPAPEAPAGPSSDWMARAQASLDRLESSYGGLLPKPNIPQPPAGPTPDFASLARAQL